MFSERGVHAQCYACNVSLHGNKLKYWMFMESHYGREVIDELMRESARTIKYDRIDYQMFEKQFTQMTEKVIADPSLAKLHSKLDMPF